MQRKIRQYLSLLLILSFITSCHTTPHQLTATTFKVEEEVKKKKITILYFWTSWCGVSSRIIPRVYIPLADSISRHNYNANIILLCGSNGADSLVKAYQRPGLQSFYINNASNGMAILDRKAIKTFIKTLFPDANLPTLDKMGFGIPITLIVSDKMNIINANGAQDLNTLLTLVKQ